MPQGKYFVLRSKHCGLELGIDGRSDSEGTLAVLCQNDPKEPHQIWFEDLATGTIRSKANELCLTVTETDNRFRLKAYVPNDQSQQWKVDGEVVRHRLEENKVLDIVSGSKECGAELCSWNFHGGSNQHWEVHYLEARLFCIVSELNGKVVDVAGANKNPGAQLVLWDMNGVSGSINQHWYEDRFGFLRSALNTFAPDASTQEVTLQPFDPTIPNRCWAIYGSTIFLQGNHDLVFDVLQSKTEAGALVGVYKRHGGPNQKWYQKFVD